ncbi:meprin A subunit alpha [Lampetra fluviatilis]
MASLWGLLLTLALVVGHAVAFSVKPDGQIEEDLDDVIDIPQINRDVMVRLTQGDILGPSSPKERNSIIGDEYIWPMPIPYILSDNLDLNAKGVILQAFEQFRLKSCLDFRPYAGDRDFIRFQKLGGCWSSVGNVRGGQELSIGQNCDQKAVVEHEILHAVGFWHEQSRSDRDDYVTIHWDEILAGKENNFEKYPDDEVDNLNTPYDYESVMHYAPLSFNKQDGVPTITANIPEFDNVIGQRLDFSGYDLLKLNRLYGCTSTTTLLDQCDFEEMNICGMIQDQQDTGDWVHMWSGGPNGNDHTVGGKCPGKGRFMFVDTSVGEAGSSALLESRIHYPRRSSQCLQFSFKMSGSDKDVLAIWVKLDDGAGAVRKMVKIGTVQASQLNQWEMAHFVLPAAVKFRYVFQAVRGASNASAAGGILLDDVSLSERNCPTGVMRIPDAVNLMETSVPGTMIYSPAFVSPEGYGFAIVVYPHELSSSNASHLGVRFQLLSRPDDDVLEWPAANRQAVITIVDQNSDVRLCMSNVRTFLSDDTRLVQNTDKLFWDRPSVTGNFDPQCNCFRGPLLGWPTFISHEYLRKRDFLKGGDLYIFVEFNDLTHLNKTEVPVAPVNAIATGDDVAVDDIVANIDAAAADVIAPREPLAPISGDGAAPARGAAGRAPMAERLARSRRHADDSEQAQRLGTCEPNPCRNGGLCRVEGGRASCRCPSGRALWYSGELCETSRLGGALMGVALGGVTTLLITSVLGATFLRSMRRRRRQAASI